MAKCEICGKGVTFGIKVSHSHRRSNRSWKPNVVKVKATALKLLNRRVPNGTHGGVRGRLLN